jgi:nucleoside-diphosphate-sugar epimerase
MAKLIIGCGYLGRRVARLWLAAVPREGEAPAEPPREGETVFAVTRSPARAAELATEGLAPIVADVTAGAKIPIQPEVRTVLYAVGFERGSARPIREVYAGGLAQLIDWLPESVDRLIYISSTGVYGVAAGSEVDERSPCLPTRDGGKASLAAEEVLRGSRFASRAIILRLAGIYGPGRIPRSADLAAGRPIDAPADGWLNLIHVDDAARIVLLAEAKAPLPRMYVVSDGQPVIRGDYYRELARLLGAPPPQFVAPPAESPAGQRAASDKRVNPARLFAELRPQLLYPSYREGLAAIVSSGPPLPLWERG